MTQSESAVRDCTALYPYETEEEGGISLRGSPIEVSAALRDQVKKRTARVGIDIVEARISHLAYSDEIAAAMLKKQQAKATIAAKKEIVSGAVGMVDLAIKQVEEENICEFS